VQTGKFVRQLGLLVERRKLEELRSRVSELELKLERFSCGESVKADLKRVNTLGEVVKAEEEKNTYRQQAEAHPTPDEQEGELYLRLDEHQEEVAEESNTAAMASDEDYAKFLDKANEDPSKGVAKSQKSHPSNVQLKTVDKGVAVPKNIKAKTDKEEWIYVTDSDEPFVGVALKLEEPHLPDEVSFAQLINYPFPEIAQKEITIHDPTEWDRNGQYAEIVDATREACQGNDVRVYRVPRGRSKVEYWLVGVDEEGMLVGVKALGVES